MKKREKKDRKIIKDITRINELVWEIKIMDAQEDDIKITKNGEKKRREEKRGEMQQKGRKSLRGI